MRVLIAIYGAELIFQEVVITLYYLRIELI